MTQQNLVDEWYKHYQDTNPEVFSDFIYQRSNMYEHHMKGTLADVCKSLEVIPGVKFVNCELVTDETQIDKLFPVKNVLHSRNILAVINFNLSAKGDKGVIEEKSIRKILLLPKIVDDFYYYLNGNRYNAVYQMVDRGTYTTERALSLRTLLMPIFLTKDAVSYTAECGFSVSGNAIKLDLFKIQINLLYYFAAKLGKLSLLLEAFNLGDGKVYLSDEYQPVDTHYSFKLGRGTRRLVNVQKSLFDSPIASVVIVSLINFLSATKPSATDEEDSENFFWQYKLGRIFSTNASANLEKGRSILVSLERILDECTKKNLIHIAPEDKSNIYDVLRWMFVFYDKLHEEDNMDFATKRIRLTEYVLLPLITKLSESTYRIFNSKRVNLARLETVFSNIGPDFIIKKLVTNQLLRYVSLTNNFDIFSALKLTQGGPQGLGENEIVLKYRGQHPSYVGRVSLMAASAGDPGVTMTMTPFISLENYFFFDTECKNRTVEELRW